MTLGAVDGTTGRRQLEQKSTRTNQPTGTSTIGCHKQGHQGKGWARARRVERLAATARANVTPYLAPALQTVLGCYGTVLYGGALPPACAPQLGHAGLCRLCAVGGGRTCMCGGVRSHGNLGERAGTAGDVAIVRDDDWYCSGGVSARAAPRRLVTSRRTAAPPHSGTAEPSLSLRNVVRPP